MERDKDLDIKNRPAYVCVNNKCDMKFYPKYPYK